MTDLFKLKSILHIPLYDKKVTDSKYYFKHTQFADAVVLDLEDGVHESFKSEARKLLSEAVRFYFKAKKPLFVRINLDQADLDLQAISNVKEEVAGLFVPKIETENQILDIVDKSHSKHLIVPIVETVRAVLFAESIFVDKHKIGAFIFGPEDLSAELGVFPSVENLSFAAQKIKMVAAAMNVPLWGTLSSFVDFKNLSEFKSSIEAAKVLGFNGCFAIHANHIPIINSVFSGDQELLNSEEQIRKTLSQKGVATFNQKMIGPPTLKRLLTLKKGK